MNNLTKTLLGGAAIGALAVAPAMAQHKHPAMHVTAMHAGHAVNKTNFLHNQGRQHLTYTFSAYTTVSFASAFHKKAPLVGSFFKWNSNGTLCSQPKQRIKVDPKKTKYAKIGTATETYSFGCPSGPTVFYGATYKIWNPDAKGHTDHFVVTDYGKFENSGTKYKGTLNLDVSVTID